MWMQSWTGWVPSPGSPLMRPAPAAAGGDYRIPPTSARREDPAYWEFFHHNAVIGPWRDTEGRPLGERGFTHPEDREGVRLELRTCPYPGIRRDHAKLMNVSALRQQTNHWADFREALELLRGRYLETYPPRTPGPLAPLELWEMCRAMVRLPQYVRRRVANPVESGHLSPLVATILKVVLGASVMLEHLTVRCMAKGLALPDVVTPKFVVDYVEEHGLFINADGVCAGPPKMIDEFLSALVCGDPSIDVDQKGTLDLQLGEAAGEAGAFFAYAREDGRLKLAANAFHARSVALGLRVLSLAERSGVRRCGGATATALDGFETALKHRAAPYLRCFDEGEMEALGRELEREASRLGDGSGRPFSPSAADRARFVDELVVRFGADLATGRGTVRSLAEALVQHLVLERSALQTITHAEDSIARITGHAPSVSRLDQVDAEAVGGPTVGTLLANVFTLDIANTAGRTIVRSRSSAHTVPIELGVP